MAELTKATADTAVYETPFQIIGPSPRGTGNRAIPLRSIQLAGALTFEYPDFFAAVQIRIIAHGIIDGYLTLDQAEKILRDLQAAVATAKAGQVAATKMREGLG